MEVRNAFTTASFKEEDLINLKFQHNTWQMYTPTFLTIFSCHMDEKPKRERITPTQCGSVFWALMSGEVCQEAVVKGILTSQSWKAEKQMMFGDVTFSKGSRPMRISDTFLNFNFNFLYPSTLQGKLKFIREKYFLSSFFFFFSNFHWVASEVLVSDVTFWWYKYLI